MMSGAQIFRIGLWAIVALVCGATLAVYLSQSATAPTSAEAAYGSPFSLVDQNGAAITEDALRGKPSAVFFGFTHCPDVCPTTLAELSAEKAALKAKGKDLNVVFVTVDPERDTPEVLKSYVSAVSPEIIAITGEPAKIAEMLKGWGVHSEKVGEGPDYSMDHTASTFLLDSDGRFAGTIAWGENPKTATEKLERLANL